MKKLLLITAFVAMLMSCNKKPDEPTNDTEPPVAIASCIDLSGYFNLPNPTTANKAEWLRINGHRVCPDTLNKYLPLFHKVSSGTSVAQAGNTFTIPWGELKSFIGDASYTRYLAFEKSSSNITDLKLIRKHTTQAPCYSIPFLYSIAKAHTLVNTDNIEFFSGTVGSTSTIVVRVQKSGTYFYDFSDEPGFLEERSPL